ncbi:MAG: trimethylamine methyltransferase family protein [Gammaproteobacteria bacterium]|nr:trimethylamine methyltransferase family protein [Gammaproteobacteria bacterium]MDH3465743.1 trimethylamine methyltransferase family protein [Gammaproteobacteria bacterium]
MTTQDTSSAEQNRKPRSSARREGGRQVRRTKRLAKATSPAIWPGVSGGTYKPLTETAMQQVHKAALEILATLGVGDSNQELLDIALAKGCHLNEHGRLCFPKALMEDIIAGAARSFVVHARGARKGVSDIECSGSKVYFATSGSAVTTFEPDTKTYRPSTLRDVYDFTRLTDKLDNIHMVGDTVVPTDVTDDFEHDINIPYTMISATEKPLCFAFRSAASVRPAIEMFDIVLGGCGRFQNEPFAIFGGCPIVSPLRFGLENLQVMMEASRLGLTSDLAVAPQSGATAPAPLAGILAQVVAETLACLAVVNLINPGCPMAFAAWPFITDLRTGSFTGGSGEEALLASAAVQMGTFYDLPNSVAAGMTDSKIPDVQHGFEKGITLTLAAMAGANRVCEAGGMMGSLMGCSFESLVIDNEILGMVLRATRGIEVNDETLSVEVIKESVINPGHFLGHNQTLEYVETEYLYPELSDRDSTDAWEQQGSPDLYERSREVVKTILATHDPAYIDPVTDQTIRSKFPILLA